MPLGASILTLILFSAPIASMASTSVSTMISNISMGLMSTTPISSAGTTINTTTETTSTSTINLTAAITSTTISTTSTTSAITTTTPPSPTVVSSISSFCGCTNFTLSLTSILFNTTNAKYQWQASPTGLNVWSNTSGLSASSSLPISSQAVSMDYRCLIFVAFIAPMNLISSLVTVTNAFCAPRVVSCSLQDDIHNFFLMGESSTQIYNLATGCAANGYDNRTGQSVSLAGNNRYGAMVSSEYSSSETLSIWIDFDDNCVFDSWEQVANRALNSTLNTPFIVSIPPIGGIAKTGVHRMRASVAFSTSPTPCSAANAYGEVHDYTVNILTSPDE